MATVTDEDVLELVDRFDIPLEDTEDIDRLQKALAEKLEAAGVPYVSKDFLDKFQYGIQLKYEIAPEINVMTRLRFAEPTVKNPAGVYYMTYRDLLTGKYSTAIEFEKRYEGYRKVMY